MVKKNKLLFSRQNRKKQLIMSISPQAIYEVHRLRSDIMTACIISEHISPPLIDRKRVKGVFDEMTDFLKSTLSEEQYGALGEKDKKQLSSTIGMIPAILDGRLTIKPIKDYNNRLAKVLTITRMSAFKSEKQLEFA